MTPLDDILFAAFLAGFAASGEGFNGEYVKAPYRPVDGATSPAFLREMRGEFDDWHKKWIEAP